MIFTQSEATAARRRFPLYLVDAVDGITPETGEAAGQPQISKAGAAWGNTTATLTSLGNGAYYVELTGAELDTLGPIQVRYKSGNTAEFNSPGVVVAYNQHDTVRLGLTAMPNAAADAAGGLPISDAGGLDIDARLGKLATGGFTAATFAADTDHYAAKSWLQRKSTATATDRYTAVWTKNGGDLTSGITVPKIQVIKRTDGTDLVAETAMTEIGASGMYKYDAIGAELMTAGESYIVVISATIDGSTRITRWPQGRDV